MEKKRQTSERIKSVIKHKYMIKKTQQQTNWCKGFNREQNYSVLEIKELKGKHFMDIIPSNLTMIIIHIL